MNTIPNPAAERGMTLVIGLIMLLMFTLMMTSTFTLSNVNLKSMGNIQLHSEVTAAANSALEQVISSKDIFATPEGTTKSVDSYTVTIAAPVCLRAADVKNQTSAETSPNMLIEGGPAASGGTGFQDTYWNVAATVSDQATGATVVVNQGIKITLPANPNPCI